MIASAGCAKKDEKRPPIGPVDNRPPPTSDNGIAATLDPPSAPAIARANDLKKPIAQLEIECKAGTQTSCIVLGGKLLMSDIDDPAKVKRAFDLFGKACEAGAYEGCTQQGEMYKHGLGRDPDLAKALSLYELGCTNKDPLGCSDLGVAYAAGRGVTKDDKKAVELYSRACAGGLWIACTNLGFMYLRGIGTAVNPKMAFDLYTKACEHDEPKACNNLGALFWKGETVKMNTAIGYAHYKKACDLGEPSSCDFVAKHAP